MLKTYKYRIYPNHSQTEKIEQTFALCDQVYNQVLDWMFLRWKISKSFPTKMDANNYVNRSLKKKYEALKTTDKFALTNATYHAVNTMQYCRKRSNSLPKYRTADRTESSYTTNFTNNNIRLTEDSNHIVLPRLKSVRAVIHRWPKEPYKIRTATVRRDKCGRYFALLLVESPDLPKTEKKEITLHLQDMDFFLESQQDRIFDLEQKKRKLESQLCRKQIGGSNYSRQSQKIYRLADRIKAIKNDFFHAYTKKITDQYDIIYIPNPDPEFREVIRQLKYKAEWKGGQVIVTQGEDESWQD